MYHCTYFRSHTYFVFELSFSLYQCRNTISVMGSYAIHPHAEKPQGHHGVRHQSRLQDSEITSTCARSAIPEITRGAANLSRVIPRRAVHLVHTDELRNASISISTNRIGGSGFHHSGKRSRWGVLPGTTMPAKAALIR